MEQVDGREVPKRERPLERPMARRRLEQKKLDDLDEAIRTARTLLRDSTAPMVSDQAFGLLPGEERT